MHRAVWVALLAVTLPANAVHAQRERGASLAFQAAGGPTVGLWLPAGARTDLGIEAGFRLRHLDDQDDDSEERFRSAALSLSLKRFVRREGATVLPYVVAGPFLTHARSRATALGATFETTNLTLGAEGGLGLDWFLTSRVSVGGHVSLRIAYLRETQETPDPFGGPPAERTRTGFSGETVTSGVRVHLYFR